MRNRRFSRLLAGSLGALSLVAMAGQAAAQSGADPKPDKPVLGGPTAQDASIPGQKRSFAGAGGQPKDRVADRALPPRIFLQAIGILRAEGTAADVRLSAAQEESLRSIQGEFMASVQAFRESHRDEIADLRSKMSPEARAKFDQRARAAGLAVPGDSQDRPGKDGDKGKGTDRPKAKRAVEPAGHPADMAESPDQPPATDTRDERIRRRLGEILRDAPSPKDAQAKAMSILSDPQRVLVQAEIGRLRAIQEQDRAKGAQGGDLSDLPENARRRLENLPPEQRREAIRRLREQRAGRGGEATPAPKPQEVDVPDPSAAPPPPRKN